MKTFALACTAAIAMGLGIGDAQSPPDTLDVRIYISVLTFACIFVGILPHPQQVRLHVAIRHELPPL